ncbi:MAG: hypothetical protein E6Q49_07980 [Limnohabitans sp.]|nr:MAG: hypothetical protein E6Q49_07980 [Limnohabitans sp.]
MLISEELVGETNHFSYVGVHAARVFDVLGCGFSYNPNIACACDECMKTTAIIFGALGVGKWRV